MPHASESGAPGSDEPLVDAGWDKRRSDADSDYRLLDAGAGERLEQWGAYRLRRPDPRADGTRTLPEREWREVDAQFVGAAGRGRWERLTDLPDRWIIAHGGIQLVVKLAPFKHTGVFPEQAEHWRWMTRTAEAAAARRGRPLEILNLFAYTGGATVALAKGALAKARHKVTHVDASKPALTWARENAAANGLASDAVRWIQDDAATFVRREMRRGRRYDAILMDPPAFGHGPRGRGGGVWRVDDQLAPLVRRTVALLADPVFVLVNHYARDADPRALADLLEGALAQPVEQGRLRLRTSTGAPLDTGVYARWRATR